MKFILLLGWFSLVSCSFFEASRNPASGGEEIVSRREKLSFNLSFSDIEFGFNEAVKNSKIIESVNHFYMDPVTRIFSVNLTVNYPLNQLLDYSAVPADKRIDDRHSIELSFRFSKTKNLAISRYLGLEVTKFKIDNDDYLNQFDIVLATVQTILANSELTDYLLVKNRSLLPSEDMAALVREIFESRSIQVFAETKKINLKLDLSMFNALSPIMNRVQDLRLWRFSPSIYETTNNEAGVSFLIVAGEGRPHKDWVSSQQNIIKDDTRTLLQVREDLYREYSNIENVMANTNAYFESLLKAEEIKFSELSNLYQSSVKKFMKNIEYTAKKALNRGNDHFIASPEYEYISFDKAAKSSIRNFVAELDRKLSIDYNILSGGQKGSKKLPLLTKRISQNLLNRGLNYLVDIDLEGEKLFEEFNMWLQPQKGGFVLQGIVNLPMKFILANIDKGLTNTDYKTHIEETKTGFPFEIILSAKMADHGKLGLDVERLNIKANGKKISFTRNSKNQRFLIEFTKTYLAKILASVKFDLELEVDPEIQRTNELKKIQTYLSELRSIYQANDNSSGGMEEFLSADLRMNPFNLSGKDHVLRKKEILFGKLIQYNPSNQLFEINVDPSVIIDKVKNVKNNLQVWGISPVKSNELNNTFMEFTLGDGIRSSQFISDLYRRGGTAENAQFAGIYYDLGRERSSVDMLFSLHFEYLKTYINQFLADMVKMNQTNIEALAKENPGETQVEIQHTDFHITQDKKLQLNFQLKTAKFGRSLTSWFRKKLSVDTYSFSTEIELKAKKVDLVNNNLINLRYYPQALSVIPKKVHIKSGSPSLINRAMMKLLNSAVRLGLNNGTVKRLLLKMVNKMMNKMYLKNNGKILGHELEKYARVQTTNSEILIFLNPKLAGAAFNVHLAGDDEAEKKAIKLSVEDQTMHFALTSGAGMAKADKLELLDIYKDLTLFLRPFEAANSKAELEKIINGQSFAQNLVKEREKSKRSFYNRYIYTMSKYDPILHVTKLGNSVTFHRQIQLGRNQNDVTSEAERTRISAAGSELMYFAAIGNFMQQKLKRVKAKMVKYGFDHYRKDPDGKVYSNYGIVYIEDALSILDKNVTTPLLRKYEERNHRINQTILANKPSYWTYMLYPDAYFANKAYQLIKK